MGLTTNQPASLASSRALRELVFKNKVDGTTPIIAVLRLLHICIHTYIYKQVNAHMCVYTHTYSKDGCGGQDKEKVCDSH